MSTETIILIASSTICYGLRRWLSGVGNAAFYAKSSKYQEHRLLQRFIKNLHALETPQWYSHSGGHFFLLLVIFRDVVSIESSFLNWIVCIVLSTLIVMAGSAIASPFFQGYINVANGRPFIDPNESKKSEFNLFGWFAFEWPRPFVGVWRYAMVLFGLLYFVAAFVIVKYF